MNQHFSQNFSVCLLKQDIIHHKFRFLLSLRISLCLVKLTSLTDAVDVEAPGSPGVLGSLVLRLPALVQAPAQAAEALGVAGGGAVAGAGLAAGAAHQPARQGLARLQIQRARSEAGVERVHLHVDVALGLVTCLITRGPRHDTCLA